MPSVAVFFELPQTPEDDLRSASAGVRKAD